MKTNDLPRIRFAANGDYISWKGNSLQWTVVGLWLELTLNIKKQRRAFKLCRDWERVYSQTPEVTQDITYFPTNRRSARRHVGLLTIKLLG